MTDRLGRPLRNLRLSVTDRCNLRCQYCMPEEEYVWLPREDILHFEEIDRLVDQFLSLGVDKVRLTGGEPLLRRDLPSLIEQLSSKPAIRDLAMTTNAVLLAGLSAAADGRAGQVAVQQAGSHVAHGGVGQPRVLDDRFRRHLLGFARQTIGDQQPVIGQLSLPA